MTPSRLQLFRGKIEKVFNLALFGSAHDSKKHGKVHLSDALLECFATLSSKSRDEEIEDFIYFILDIYQFHGVPVAVSELDLDQVSRILTEQR
jgi:separase